MALLELLLILIAMFLVTQILLPLALPNSFRMFWFFKKKKDIKERVEETYALREEIKENLKNLESEADKELENTLETTDKIFDLKNNYSPKTNKK